MNGSSSHQQPTINVGLLGATGVVGQQFIRLLQQHPWFKLTVLGASERSAGQLYSKAASWKLTTTLPPAVAQMTVVTCDPQHFKGCKAIFSALDASVAGDVELAFAKAGFPVFSNARNWRYDDTVPILVPYVNSEHLDVIEEQQKRHSLPAGGYIITNANCSSTGLVVALKPLLDKYGLDKVLVVTMQALSGAGYPGVASLDIYDNVYPFISGEEPKMEMEPQKMLGHVDVKQQGNTFVSADFTMSAMCNRVPVIDGHTECVSVKLRNQPKDLQEVVQLLKDFTSPAQKLKLPSAPEAPLIVHEVDNRPQPRLDRDAGNGMIVTVGRIRKCNVLDLKFNLVSHNTVIGAAGGSILNAELAHAKGRL